MTALASVVVASFRGHDLLAQCLESLRPQCARIGAELIVARATGAPGETPEELVAGCRTVAAPRGADIPRLRGLGLAVAQGDWVMVTEDHCVADPGWIEAFLAASSPDLHVLGGSMGNARRERSIDCGAFFAEYGFYGATRDRDPAREPPAITGANVAYHRSVVASVAEWAQEGSWEGVIHDRLHAGGCRFRLVPAARIRQNHSYGLGAFCRERFKHGRAYAATRRQGLSRWQQAALLAGTPALPPLLAVRIIRSVSPEERRYLVKALPALIAFLVAWSLGEAVGYARGIPQ